MPNSVTINLRVKTAALSELEKVKSKLNGLSTSKGFQNAVMGVGISAGMAAWSGLQSAISGVGQYLGEAVQAASNLTEAQNKSNVVFRDSSRIIDDFAATSARSWGLSQRAAYEATGTLGALFSTIGLTSDASADMSVKVTKLAVDLGSFYNVGTEEVLANIRSGLVGEAEPLRKFGILLNEATVKAKAMKMGLGDANGTLSEGAKLQARYALILEQSALAQGDFANTSSGYANTQKTLTAVMEDLSAEIGLRLMPVMIKLAVAVRDYVVPALEWLVSLLNLVGEANEYATIKLGRTADELFRIQVGPNAQQLGEWERKNARDANLLAAEVGRVNAAINGTDRAAGPAAGGLSRLAGQASSAARAVARVAEKAAMTTGPLQTVEGAAKDAADEFDRLHDKVNDALDALIESSLGPAALSAKLTIAKGDLRDAQKELGTLEAKGRKTADDWSRIKELRLRVIEGKEDVIRLSTQMTLLGDMSMSSLVKQMKDLGVWTRDTTEDVYDLEAALRNAGVTSPVKKPGPKGPRPAQFGGPVSAGESLLVGETGPEIFRPTTAGTIISNRDIGRMSGTPVQNTIVVQVDGRELARVLDERQYWMLQTAPVTTRAS